MAQPKPKDILTHSFANANLHSRSATLTPNIIFPQTSTNTIGILTCTDARQSCMFIKDWLKRSYAIPKYTAPGILRFEHLALHDIKGTQAGYMLAAPNTATLDTVPVTIFAILIPHDPKIRWFYSLLPIQTLIKTLAEHNLITITKKLPPGDKRHKRLYTFIRESFTAATTLPQHPDYINAQALTDCSPPGGILYSDIEAVRKIEANDPLHDLAPKLSAQEDLSDDRYLLDLHVAERQVASMARLKCAEYLLVKRNFFKAFWEEVYRSDKKIEAEAATRGPRVRARNATPAPSSSTPAPSSVAATPAPFSNAGTPTPSRAVRERRQATPTPASVSRAVREGRQATPALPSRRGGARTAWRHRVRSELAHQQWLQNVYDMTGTRAKLLVMAWRELGLLDEGRYLPWLKAGGISESIADEEDGDAPAV